ncbi:MAG: Holliday junction branch migration DNA helicase RuvB [Spirochaetales bacterium]|jgi:holliday junction DNA helicase RuvB|nr:Holliday junction branch migration DNA helicase RuvB [Spirochaetales bacterium]
MSNDDSGFLSAQFHEDEDSTEASLRPRYLSEFQGQSALKENLSIFIQAARERKESLDHVFLSGPPGLGKTTLAAIMANELGAEFKATSAPALDKPKDLAGILTTLPEASVFFIDEIHRLKPAIEEMLYTAMEDFEIDWVIGQGVSARTLRIPISPFTLMGATTKAGRVSGPMHSRFGIPVRMNYYTDEEIVQIVHRSSKILDVRMAEGAAESLAKCSRGTPRIANRLLRRMRDFAQVVGEGIVNAKVVEDGLKRLEIDAYGLESHDREILKTMIERYSGGPVGAETLAISVGEAIETLEDFYEPYLIQRGFIKRTPRGRMVTELAYEHLRARKKKHEDQGLLF